MKTVNRKNITVEYIRSHVNNISIQTAQQIINRLSGELPNDDALRMLYDALHAYTMPLPRNVFMRALKIFEYNIQELLKLKILRYETGKIVNAPVVVSSFRAAVILLNDKKYNTIIKWLCDNNDNTQLPLLGCVNNSPTIFIIPDNKSINFRLGGIKPEKITNILESCGLKTNDLLNIIKQIGWNNTMLTMQSLQSLPYAEYKLTHRKLGMIIQHAIQSGRMQWLSDFLIYLVNDRPVITQSLTLQWFDEQSQYPFEFYVESGKAIENYTIDDYNTLMSEKMSAFADALTMDTMFHADSMRLLLSSNLMLTDKTRNVNSKNITRWMKAISGLKPLDERLVNNILPHQTASNGSHSPSNIYEISGLNIFSDITFSTESWISAYRTFTQSSNATIEYLNAINADNDDSAYRWCIWLRAQRALRENKALIVPSKKLTIKDIYYHNPIFNHCPPELITWLHDGIIPVKLTYDKLGECIMPKDVIRRMQAYPVSYDEWLANGRSES